ncbi:hypothetical protein NDU88_004457 [Pleurodeles waltl]|uniref:Uncharacterized protein n=1 Tax=Pleurodeles waltl TaxID=8319 RepID=A0AAV7V3I4_PLEWA|nr:hypothetical protein NDU88_004457 [Pleurodeles waltl]
MAATYEPTSTAAEPERSSAAAIFEECRSPAGKRLIGQMGSIAQLQGVCHSVVCCTLTCGRHSHLPLRF